MGAVVIAYNLPDFTGQMKLTGSIIADIFMGKVTKWDDDKIKALNPGVAIPSTDIVVCHRSDGSGTSYIFTDYLSKVSPAWSSDAGKGTAVKWPAGLGGKGNEGVTALTSRRAGARHSGATSGTMVEGVRDSGASGRRSFHKWGDAPGLRSRSATRIGYSEYPQLRRSTSIRSVAR